MSSLSTGTDAPLQLAAVLKSLGPLLAVVAARVNVWRSADPPPASVVVTEQ